MVEKHYGHLARRSLWIRFGGSHHFRCGFGQREGYSLMDQEKALRNLTIVAKAILNLVERGASQEDVAPLFDVITDIADEVFARHSG